MQLAGEAEPFFLLCPQRHPDVNALAGKTTIASLLYFVSLALLWAIWRNKDVDLKRAFYIGLGLGVLGAIGTFPTFFQMFAA